MARQQVKRIISQVSGHVTILGPGRVRPQSIVAGGQGACLCPWEKMKVLFIIRRGAPVLLEKQALAWKRQQARGQAFKEQRGEGDRRGGRPQSWRPLQLGGEQHRADLGGKSGKTMQKG